MHKHCLHSMWAKANEGTHNAGSQATTKTKTKAQKKKDKHKCQFTRDEHSFFAKSAFESEKRKKEEKKGRNRCGYKPKNSRSHLCREKQQGMLRKKRKSASEMETGSMMSQSCIVPNVTKRRVKVGPPFHEWTKREEKESISWIIAASASLSAGGGDKREKKMSEKTPFTTRCLRSINEQLSWSTFPGLDARA